MRVSRASLGMLVAVALLGGTTIAAPDPSAHDGAVLPFTEFSGRVPCLHDADPGVMDAVFMGRFDEGSLIRREIRDASGQLAVEGMSDPRVNGTWAFEANTDEYYYPHAAREPRLMLGLIALRIENEEGAWVGLGESVFLASVPLAAWATDPPVWTPEVLFGEGAYEGLMLVLASRMSDTGPACSTEVQGLIIEARAPRLPLPLGPLDG